MHIKKAALTSISLIAGTFLISRSVMSPSSLQCFANNDCNASPSEAGGYSTDDELVEEEEVATIDSSIELLSSPCCFCCCCCWLLIRWAVMNERERPLEVEHLL